MAFWGHWDEEKAFYTCQRHLWQRDYYRMNSIESQICDVEFLIPTVSETTWIVRGRHKVNMKPLGWMLSNMTGVILKEIKWKITSHTQSASLSIKMNNFQPRLDFPLRISRGTNPNTILLLNLWHLHISDSLFLLFKIPSLWYFISANTNSSHRSFFSHFI